MCSSIFQRIFWRTKTLSKSRVNSIHFSNVIVGANVWSVDPYFAEAGYVLGWQPDKDTPLDVGYYNTDLSFEELRSEYKYEEVYEVEVGNIFSYYYAYANIEPVMHMVRAYAFVSTMFAETFSGKNCQ